jgi:predicted P-loop ATPase
MCKTLAGDEYFSDSLPDIRTKDACQHIRGRWLIELPELSALSRGDIEAWKAFITRDTERYRQPYGRRESHEPRQCLFIGTTNKDEFLHDETGNRRFWPIRVGTIDIDALKRDREQLFAEAVERYRAGDPWWPNKEFERQVIAQEQEDCFEEDVWQPAIEQFLADEWRDRVLVGDIAQVLGFNSISKIGTADQRRITRILRKLEWRHGKRGTGGKRYYYRPNPGSEKKTMKSTKGSDAGRRVTVPSIFTRVRAHTQAPAADRTRLARYWVKYASLCVTITPSWAVVLGCGGRPVRRSAACLRPSACCWGVTH